MWKCKNCNEQIEDNFDSCWSCGMYKDSSPPLSATETNYQVYHKEVKPEEIVLTAEPECGAVVPTWWIGTIVSIIVAASASNWLVFFIGIGITYMITRFFQNARNEEQKATIAKNTTQQNINTAQNIIACPGNLDPHKK